MRIDVVSIFPDYLDAAGALAARQGPGGRPARRARPRPARLDPRPAPHRRRHPVRRRRRHGHEPEPWGEALDAVARDAASGAVARRAHPVRRAVHPGARRGAGRRRRTWSSPAAATRASTSACWTHAATRLRGARDLARRLRAQRRRGGRAGGDRGGRAAAARLHGQPESLAEESHGARAAGVPRLHQARTGAARRPDVLLRRPRRIALAPRPGAAAYGGPRPDLLHPSRTRRRRLRARRLGGPPTPASCSPCSGPAGSRRRGQPGSTSRRCTRRSRRAAGWRVDHLVLRSGRLVGACGPAGGRVARRPADGRPGPPRPGWAAAAGTSRRRTPTAAAALFTGAAARQPADVQRAGYRRTGSRRSRVVHLSSRRAEAPDFAVPAPCGRLDPRSVASRPLVPSWTRVGGPPATGGVRTTTPTDQPRSTPRHPWATCGADEETP